jgi:hypothetical protein
MLIQQCSVKPFDESITLGTSDFRCPVLNLLKLQEQFKRMPVRSSAILTSIV